MNKLKLPKLLTLSFVVLALASTNLMAQGSWQPSLSYSRPGTMINVPTTSLYSYPYLLRVGLTSQYEGSTVAGQTLGKYGLFLETDVTRTFRAGLSAVQGFKPGEALQIALHVQDRLVTYGETAVGIGVSDITFSSSSSTSTLSQQVQNLSYYIELSRESGFSENSVKTFLGLGTGRYSSNFGKTALDTQYVTPGVIDTITTVALSNTVGIFLGVMVNTNILTERGGLDIMMEWDGAGVNLGMRVPISSEYKVNFALSNLQNLPAFGDDANNPPGISIGLDYLLPRVRSTDKDKRRLSVEGVVTEEGLPMRTVIDSSWHKAQEQHIISLRDSLRMSHTELDHLNRMVDQLEQRNKVLEDSVAALHLARHVSDARINQALKHLSRSLRLFYNEDYDGALIEINQALEFNPNLALAYARRGSIYYKLNDLERATINWNLALKIDPTYDEVRNILRALNENRLRKTLSIKNG